MVRLRCRKIVFKKKKTMILYHILSLIIFEIIFSLTVSCVLLRTQSTPNSTNLHKGSSLSEQYLLWRE